MRIGDKTVDRRRIDVLWGHAVLWSAVCALLLVCWLQSAPATAAAQEDRLYAAFCNPPAEARPWVRWWWNGNCVTEKEVLRELDLMKRAGIGGVEINPIAMPGGATPTADKPLDWLSPEWNRVLRTALDGARQRGMGADMIVGSGWPFGGRFLDDSETVQGVGLNTREIRGPGEFSFPVADLLKLPERIWYQSKRTRSKLLFLRLIPEGAANATACVDLLDRVRPDGTVAFRAPDGRHTLCAGVLQHGFRTVVHGAPGADGVVLDHFKRAAVEKYLHRVSDTLGPLMDRKMGERVRAMFCDSIELSGANWTDDLAAEFQRRRGYSLTPYLPFVFTESNFQVAAPLRETAGRARYDFSKTLVEVFHERFVQAFHDWCRQNGMQSRYQAYGGPWLYGMLDGYLIPDIPEGDTWIHFSEDSVGRQLNQTRYAVWNKYAASAARLGGKRLVSCEAMTNLGGVFRASLEDVKQATDLDFMTGVTHSVLHGYSYSPPEAGFPGWVRYGTFFNEKNTWWPYFPRWADYHARIAAVLQAAKAQGEVAILGPGSDVWSAHGLERAPFIATPWYLHELWQAVSQSGATADYVSEAVVQRARWTDGKFQLGSAAYDALLVVEAESLEPETAEAIAECARAGGKIVFVGRAPSRAPSLTDASRQDRRVAEAMRGALAADPRHVAVVAAPGPSSPGDAEADRDRLLAWTAALLRRFEVAPAVVFDPPDRRLFQVHHGTERQVFFLANLDQRRALSFTARFRTGGKIPWLWDPETGSRRAYPFTARPDELQIHLEPFQSMLLVFEPEMPGRPGPTPPPPPSKYVDLKGTWQGSFTPVAGQPFERTFEQLADLSASSDPALSAFAGAVVYRTQFTGAKGAAVLDLGDVRGISEATLNGRPLGARWWGRHVYPIDHALVPGNNILEVKLTSVLFNYCRSLKGNLTAQHWVGRSRDGAPEPVGLLGPVRLGIPPAGE